MKNDGDKTYIYHITDIDNLAKIIARGALLSDAIMSREDNQHTKIGYSNIKLRRLTQIQVKPSERYVGEYVPFYFCPRSPMLFTINKGNTGRPVGCQRTILHLVSTVGHGLALGPDWAISDRNAGISYVDFFRDLDALNNLNWEAIRTNNWQGLMEDKMAEFLVADQFPWESIIGIACYDDEIKTQVEQILLQSTHRPVVIAKRGWYY